MRSAEVPTTSGHAHPCNTRSFSASLFGYFRRESGMGTGAHPSIRSSAVRRPRRLTLSAAWLAVSGGLGVFYAGIVPLLPPVVATPVPLVATAVGVAGVAAAVGVWRLTSWGRWLGVACLLIGVLQSAGYALWRATAASGVGSTSPAPLVDLLVAVPSFAVSLAVLWVLLARWPSAGA